MIFRRYITLFLLLIVLCFAYVGLRVSPYLRTLPTFTGVAQKAGANYPLRSADRFLLDLSGSWQGYSSLSAAASGTVASKEYSKNSAKTIPVPGSWQVPVVTKQFFLNNQLAGRSFRLDLLGAGNRIQVFINGFGASNFLGSFAPDDVPFSIDIPAPRLKFGQVNTIAIKFEQPEAAGRWFSFPGLTGEVYLEALSSTEIEAPQISTQLAGDTAFLSYNIPVQSDDGQDSWTYTVSLFDQEGSLVASNSQTVHGGSTPSALTGKLSVPKANLWSPGSPYLYKLSVILTSGRGERDSYTVPVGIRTLQFQGSSLLLNGQKLVPKILLRVNDAPVSGGAANQKAVDDDLKWAKDHGYNIIYVPDRMPQPYMFDAADRDGLLVLCQSLISGTSGAAPGAQQLKHYARIHDVFGYHASFMAQGLGIQLDTGNGSTESFLSRVKSIGPAFYSTLAQPNLLRFTDDGTLPMNAPYLADFLAAKPSFNSGDFITAYLNPAGLLGRDRTAKNPNAVPETTAQIPVVAYAVLAVTGLLLLVRSWALGNLRYADLAVERPRRKLRGIIKQQAYWYLLRLAVLSLVFAELLARFSSGPLLNAYIDLMPLHSWQVISWYLLGNPLDLAFVLFAMGLIFSCLLILPTARTLPGRPHPVGVVFWLEKRKRWIIALLGLWLWTCYGGPTWIVWIGLLGGMLLVEGCSAYDVKKAAGKSYYWVYLGVLLIAAGIITALNWQTFVYLYHWIRL